MAAATSAISSSPWGRNSCRGGSSRRIVTGRPAMISNNSTKSARCIGRNFAIAARRVFLVVGENHLPHRLDTVLFEKHVLGAAQPDSFGAETDRRFRVGRRVGVRAHAKLAHLVGPADQGGKFSGQLRLDHLDLAGQHLAGRSVDRDVVALFERLSAGRHRAPGIVDAQRACARNAGLAHAARHDGSVRGHAAARGEDALGRVHAVDVFGRCLDAHQDDLPAVGFELRRLVRRKNDLAGCGAGRRRQAGRDDAPMRARIDRRVQQLIEGERIDAQDGVVL